MLQWALLTSVMTCIHYTNGSVSCSQFLSLAVGTIDGCYNENRERTLALLSDMQKKNHWRVNLLKIALRNINRRVFSTQAYRNYTKYIWMGSIAHCNSLLRVSIAIWWEACSSINISLLAECLKICEMFKSYGGFVESD